MNKPIPVTTKELLEELRKAFGTPDASRLADLAEKSESKMFLALGELRVIEYIETWQQMTDDGRFNRV